MKSTSRGLMAVLAASFLTYAVAAGYPERPIDLIVPWGPGGGADKFARTLTPEIGPVGLPPLPVLVPVPPPALVPGLEPIPAPFETLAFPPELHATNASRMNGTAASARLRDHVSRLPGSGHGLPVWDAGGPPRV